MKHCSHRFRLVLCLLLGTAILSTSPTGCQRSSEKDAVVKYLDEIMPVLEARNQWIADQNALVATRNPQRETVLATLSDLTRRMSNIYLDVQRSQPPNELRAFKDKLSDSCEQSLQNLALMTQAITTGDTTLATKLNEGTFRANDLHEEAARELKAVLDKYHIDLADR